MAFMNKCSGNSTRPGVQVFITAPHREIDIVIVQMEVNISNGMSQIESNNSANLMTRICDSFNVEKLAGVILNTTEYYKSQFISVFFDRVNDVTGAQGKLSISGTHLNQRFLRV